MDVDSAGLVASLKAANPGLDVYSHEEVATVDAWKEALRDNASIGSDAHFAKNLLFKVREQDREGGGRFPRRGRRNSLLSHLVASH